MSMVLLETIFVQHVSVLSPACDSLHSTISLKARLSHDCLAPCQRVGDSSVRVSCGTPLPSSEPCSYLVNQASVVVLSFGAGVCLPAPSSLHAALPVFLPWVSCGARPSVASQVLSGCSNAGLTQNKGSIVQVSLFDQGTTFPLIGQCLILH